MWKSNTFGGLLAFVASVLSNYGVNRQKKYHQSIEDRNTNDTSSSSSYIYNLQWWSGFSLIMAGALGDFVALAFARQSIVAAVGGGSTIIANLFFAQYMNNEKLVGTDILGVACVIAAVILLAFTVDQAETYDINQLKQMILAPSFLLYVALQVVVIAFIFCFKINNGMFFSSQKNSSNKIPFYYAGIAGIIGAMSVLLGKCTAEIVLLTIQGENQFKNDPESMLFIFGMIATISLQTLYLNRALALGDVMVVFPIFQVFWVGFSVVGGIVFYNEAGSFTTAQWIAYPFVMLLMVLGIASLTQHRKQQQHQTSSSSHSKIVKQQLHEPLL